MTNFQLEEFTKIGERLLTDTKKVFAEYSDLGFGEVDLPETMQPEDGAVKLVFVGQYSAGKSSIIKMLSGIETEIGAGIKTQEAQSYSWNGLEIIDTPGIHTELRPDHDEKTYYEIDHAALLIFVVTNEGFDDRMGNHFRKLAIEQDRGKNMVLVVNKMDRTALGNEPEQQKIIAEDLKKVIHPLTPEQLYISFLDTDSYFEGLEEDDEETKKIYFEQSGREKFIENLNNFVASRGVISKLQSPLETLKSSITNVIGESKNFDIDSDIEKIEELLKRKQNAIWEGKRKIKVEIEELAFSCAQKIKAEGSSAANEIVPGISEDTATRAVEAAQDQAKLYLESCEAEIFDRISDTFEEINNELSLIDSSNFANNLKSNLKNKTGALVPAQNNYSQQNNFEGFVKGMGGMNAFLNYAGIGAKGASKITLPLLGESVKVAGVVKDVGHFFGYAFKPWGAVNLVKGAANILGYIGIALTAYQLLKKFFGEDEDKKMRDNLLKAQNKIIQEFDRSADDIRNEIVKVSTEKLDALSKDALNDLQEKISNFQNKKAQLKNFAHKLEKILDNVEILMDEVQATKA